MNKLPLMNLGSLSDDARALIYLHITNTERQLTGTVSEDTSIPYVVFREQTFSKLAVGGFELGSVIRKFGGLWRLNDTSYCLSSIYESLKGNSQRAVVRSLLWKFMDELEFDMHINTDVAYNYKWNLVNQIIKDKFFG